MGHAYVDKFSEEELKRLVAKANSFRNLALLLGYTSDGGNGYKVVKDRVEQYGFDTSHFRHGGKTTRSPENIFVENSTANQSVLRRWYERGKYTEYKCAICGLPAEWNGKPLVLTLDHINGNHRDDRLENLRWVCPNCDRQLPTYSRGSGRVQK